MTAYNRQKYIADAIESVLASTYRNLELIIVDDCSKDNTVAIARQYASKDSRVSVYVNEKNLGDYPNRNQAASYAKGAYIKYVDADDTIYPWGLEVVVKYMEQNPEAGYGLDSIEQDPVRPFPILLNPTQAYERNYFYMSFFNKAPGSCIIRTNVFRDAGGFSGKWMVGDVELWHKLSRTYNVLLMPHGVIWSRVHDEQESKQTRDSSLVSFKYTVVQMENVNNENCPLDPAKKKIIQSRIARALGRSVLRSIFIERNIKAARQKMEWAQMSLGASIFHSLKSDG